METDSIAVLRRKLLQFENDNKAILQERDKFQKDVKTFRSKVSALESHVEDLEIQNRDLKRKLSRVEAFPPISKKIEPAGSSKEVIEIDEDEDTQESVTAPLPIKRARLSMASSSGPSTKSPTTSTPQESIPRATRSKRGVETVDGAEQTATKAKRNSDTESRMQQAGLSLPVGQPTALSCESEPAKSLEKHTPVCATKIRERVQPDASTSTATRHIPIRRAGLKIDAGSLVLSDQHLSKYLEGCARLTIDPHPPPTLLKRSFISQTYTGNTQVLWTQSNYKGRKFLFPILNNNPDAPTYPGNPGLMICSRTDILGTFTVFSRVQIRPPMWEYMGEYETSVVGPLPSSVFKAQKQVVKDTWAETIDMRAPYSKIRDRMASRKGGALTRTDIIRALERGDEHIDLVKMDCLSYDHQFLAHTMSKLKFWTPPRGESKKVRKKASTEAQSGDDSEEYVD